MRLEAAGSQANVSDIMPSRLGIIKPMLNAGWRS
jgi:hypothetical protein